MSLDVTAAPTATRAPSATPPAVWPCWLGGGVALAALVVLYFSTFVRLAAAWNVDPNYSHGWLVLVASAALTWLAHRPGEALPTPIGRETSRGFALVTGGVLLHGLAWLTNFLFLDVFALVLILWGALFVIGGRAAFRRYAFAAGFLLFMAPIPIGLLQPLTIAMQQFIAATSAWLLEIFGLTVYREGYLIHLPGYSMEVGQACSGVRQAIAFAALGAAVGHLCHRGALFTGLVTGWALVCAVAANLLRVVLSGMVLQFAGQRWAEGVFHTLEGLSTFVLGAAILLASCVLLAKLDDRRRAHRAKPTMEETA